MADILDVSCDEAGHTGPDLLAKDQRYFAFSSVAISDTEASEIITKARTDHPVQMPELKASKLIRSKRGRELVSAVLTVCEGRSAVSVYDKVLALCCWLFEYIYEPVFQPEPWLLYEKNLHRFVAMYTWLWLMDPESDARAAIEQFQRYVRSRDPNDAPILFAAPRLPLSGDGSEHPFESVLRFAYGYRNIIIADNARLDTELPDGGRWTLDLSASSLWSHLNHWGASGKALRVHCDESKPLQAFVGEFTGDDRDPGIRRARKKGYEGQLGWQLAEPISFVDSRTHPGVQLADIVAGAAMAVLQNRGRPEFEQLSDRLEPLIHPESILPDKDVIDPETRSAMVNAVVLYGLATRAERSSNPSENLRTIYRLAESSWVRGEFGGGKRR